MDFGPADSRRPKKVRSQRRKDRHQEQLRAAFDPLKVKPDWMEYHRRFCAFHGGNEVEIRGKLVLPDGWSISSTSYSGPEWPPPADPHELAVLLTEYWAERRGIVLAEIKLLRMRRDDMLQFAMRSLPVPRQVLSGRDEDGRAQFEHEDISTKAIDARLDWLVADAEHSLDRIKELSHDETRIPDKVLGGSCGDGAAATESASTRHSESGRETIGS